MGPPFGYNTELFGRVSRDGELGFSISWDPCGGVIDDDDEDI